MLISARERQSACSHEYSCCYLITSLIAGIRKCLLLTYCVYSMVLPMYHSAMRHAKNAHAHSFSKKKQNERILLHQSNYISLIILSVNLLCILLFINI